MISALAWVLLFKNCHYNHEGGNIQTMTGKEGTWYLDILCPCNQASLPSCFSLLGLWAVLEVFCKALVCPSTENP